MLYVSDDRRIQCIKLDSNVGVGKALNKGLESVSTEYYLTLDSDDWLDPSAIEVLYKEMRKQPKDTSLIYGNSIKWIKRKGK